MDSAYTGYDSSGRYFFTSIDFMASQGGELQERGIRVNEGRNTTTLAGQKVNDMRCTKAILPGQHLPSSYMLLSCLLGPPLLDSAVQLLQPHHDIFKLARIVLEVRRGRVNTRRQD